MQNLDIRSVRAFIAVVDEGSTVLAARKLATAQSNISSHLSKLESILGAVLFARNGKLLQLTANGEKFVAHARRLLAVEAETLESMKSGMLTDELGVIGVPDSLAVIHLKHSLMDSALEDVTIVTGTTDVLVKRVSRGEIHGAIVIGKIAEGDVEQVEVASVELKLLMAKRHRTVAEMKHRQLLAFREGCFFRHIATRWTRDVMHWPLSIIECSSLDLLLALTAKGQGYCVLPKSITEKQKDCFPVTVIDLPNELAKSKIYWISRPNIAESIKNAGDFLCRALKSNLAQRI